MLESFAVNIVFDRRPLQFNFLFLIQIFWKKKHKVGLDVFAVYFSCFICVFQRLLAQNQ